MTTTTACARRIHTATRRLRRRHGARRQQCDRAVSPATEAGLAVLDINMPGGDGFAVCAYIRHHSRMPVIMLSARDGDADIIQRARTRRRRLHQKAIQPQHTDSPRTARCCDAAPRRQSHDHQDEGALLDLGPPTLEVAEQAARADAPSRRKFCARCPQPGRLVAMEQLATAAWGTAGTEERHALRQCMHRLRRKLEGAHRDRASSSTRPCAAAAIAGHRHARAHASVPVEHSQRADGP